MSNWKYLSYQLSPNHYAYGNGKRIRIEQTNSIQNGDSSNNAYLNLPTHFGTHIDFPYHFDNNGKNCNDFSFCRQITRSSLSIPSNISE